MRVATCPHCGGGVEVVDNPIYVDGVPTPVQWAIVKARCIESGCELADGDIPERQD